MAYCAVESKLAEMGHSLPLAPAPLGAYRAFQTVGDMLYVSMQGPLLNGMRPYVGKLGLGLNLESGQAAARLAALNTLAQIKLALGGFTRLRTVVRLDGVVACSDDFLDHPAVLDGASDLLSAVLGDRAGHVRSVFGARNIAGDVPVAVMAIAQIHP